MNREKYKKDERVGFLYNFIYEFGLVFIIVFANSYGLIYIYNELIQAEFSIPMMSVYIILFLLTGSVLCALFVYVTRARIFSRTLQDICSAAQRVANGDFNVRLNVYEDKKHKSELDILKEDFNKMVISLSSVESLQNDFVADVSHEIKTPLSIIQGYADLLVAGNADKETSIEYINLMTNQIHKLNELVTNILKLNKIQNQGITITEKFFLDEQIRCCALNYTDAFDEKKINLDIELSEVVVKAEKNSLELVWNNLLQNALKFCNENGKVSVNLVEKGGMAIVTVKDTGCGMSEETQKHMFEKFYQGDSSHSTEGNGLGLALVKKVVDNTNGSIKVISKMNKGSEFIITIPTNR